MKRKITVVLMFVLTVLSIMPSISVKAGEQSIQSSLYLERYVAYIYHEGNGNISVWFEVEGTGTMDEIGALSISIQEKSISSSEWLTVATFNHNDYENLLAYNKSFHYSYVSSYGNTGNSYRAYLTVWAGKGGNGDSRTILTNTVDIK